MSICECNCMYVYTYKDHVHTTGDDVRHIDSKIHFAELVYPTMGLRTHLRVYILVLHTQTSVCTYTQRLSVCTCTLGAHTQTSVCVLRVTYPRSGCTLCVHNTIHFAELVYLKIFITDQSRRKEFAYAKL
jgi:hypothetical protein